MANVSKLLYTTVVEDTFLVAIDPATELKSDLLKARTKIREALRVGFAIRSREIFGVTIRPRFFTQGSYSYKTLNFPAWPPGQQVDLDDGCYLPLSFVKGAKPSLASSMFFEFVEEVLQKLADAEGWTTEKKDTCCRVIISSHAHIDVPLYAIPDAEFVLLEAAMNRSIEFAQDSKRPDNWEALPSDSVLLAHRKEDWKVSDPRKLHKWFLDAVNIYGEKLRRVCRYLKAWRDHNSPDLDGVSSILLMVCAWQAFEAKRRPFIPDREDEALLVVLEKLGGYLEGDVANPTDRDESVNRIPHGKRATVVKSANEFADRLRTTITTITDPSKAIVELQTSLGIRVPDRPDLVSVTETAKITILSQPRKEIPAQEVGRSQSG